MKMSEKRQGLDSEEARREIIKGSSEQIMESLDEAFQEYPRRKVLMKFMGRFVDRWADGTPYISNGHEIIHRIVSLGKDDEKQGELYLCDTQEVCRFWENYCGKNESIITLNRFDDNINPSILANFVGEGSLDYPLAISPVEQKFGRYNRGDFSWATYKLDFIHNNGMLRLEESRQGSKNYEKEESANLQMFYGRENKRIPYDLMKSFIEKLRRTYAVR